MKLMRLKKRANVYILSIHELGKKPTYICWDPDTSIVHIGAPCLPWERERSLFERDAEMLRIALKTGREEVLEEVLYHILKDTLRMWGVWGK